MQRAVLATLLTLAGSVAQASDLLGTIGGAIDKGADLVGKAGKAVGDTIDSTSELIKDEETPAQTRAKLDRMESEIIVRLLSENPTANATFEQSSGYAAFDMRQVTIFPLSGGYGRGVAVAPDGLTRTYMQMGTGGVGAAFGIGGFASQFVIMFETQVDFDRFIENGYDAAADAGYMEGDEKSKETVRFTNGQSYFVLDKNGWRVNANATGTKYWPDEDLN